MQEERHVNGVNVSQLANTIHAVKENSELSQFKFRAQNKWIDGAHCFTMIKDFFGNGKEDTSRPKPFILDADEPDMLLGKDYGPNATEALLFALASCLNTTLIYHAAAKGIHIDELEFDMEGELDLRGFLGISDEIRRGFQNIQVTCRISGDAPESKLRELVEMAQKYSPVFDIVTNQTPVKVTMESKEVYASM